MKQVIQGGVLIILTSISSNNDKNNAQNNTDWSNKEYDQLLKDANNSFYESQVNVIPHYKSGIYLIT